MRTKHSPWQELVANIADLTHLPEKKIELVLRLFGTSVIKRAYADLKVQWPAVGTFEGTTRKARTIRNPVTKALMTLPAKRTLKFHAAKAARERLNR